MVYSHTILRQVADLNRTFNAEIVVEIKRRVTLFSGPDRTKILDESPLAAASTYLSGIAMGFAIKADQEMAKLKAECEALLKPEVSREPVA